MLALLAAGAWITRGSWLPERYRVAPRTTAAWQPVSDAGAQRTERALEQLSEPRGPVYQTLSAADVASLAFNEAAKRYPGAVDSVGARVEGNRLAMRARVAVA